MPGDPLFDTNAVIAWLNTDPNLWRRYVGRDKRIAVWTVGELYYGAAKSLSPGANRKTVSEVLSTCLLVPAGVRVAERYGILKEQLRAGGKPIPDNDLWIAATAVEHGLTLVTRDVHFAHVPGLSVEAW